MEEERKWKVYKHTNKMNNKCYIGITSKIPEIRWKNGNGYQNKTYFRNAIQKYGWDNFKHEILFENLTEQEAKDKEIELIAFYKSNEFGCYNMTNGGDGILGLKFSEDTLTHMSKIKKGITPYWCKNGMPKYVRDKISKARIGMKFSDEHILNLRNSHLGKITNEETKEKMRNNSPFNKKVICLETLEIFSSISNATKKYPKCGGHIGEVCIGKRNKCNGLHWMYYEDYIKQKGVD